MSEKYAERRMRLKRENRWKAYCRRRTELHRERPKGVSKTAWAVKLNSQLDVEFGPGSLIRLKIDAWWELARRVGASRRAHQSQNFNWAWAHLNSLPGDIDPNDVPSIAAIHLVIYAIESPENRQDFALLRRRVNEAIACRLAWQSLLAERFAIDFVKNLLTATEG